MAFDYEAMGQRVTDLLTRYGVVMTLRKLSKSGPDYDPVITEEDSDCIGVLSRYKDRDIDGTRILSKDRRIILAADQEEPTPRHQIIANSVLYQIIEVTKMEPASTILAYEIQVRA